MKRAAAALASLTLLLVSLTAGAQVSPKRLGSELKGLDNEFNRMLKEWNAPGFAVGIVVGDKVVFAKGYGYRDVGNKLPMTPRTLIPIASNTKLFTAVAAGLLVSEGKLDWDEPVREKAPELRFATDALDASVTLRDMLSHRTGITRHDMIWYRSPLGRAELMDRVRLMAPREGIRTAFIYNNMMYASVGRLIDLKGGQPYEEFVTKRILAPLGMKSTVWTIAEMHKAPEFGVPYNEKRDSDELVPIPPYEETAGMAPAGALISSVEDLGRWLIALMNDGQLDGRQLLPAEVLSATLEPAIPTGNTLGEAYGFWEILNPIYGLGRWTAVYRGHRMTYHGGDIDGFHSQVTYLPGEKIGVAVLVIGDHCYRLYNTVPYLVFDRLLGLKPVPWNARFLEMRKQGKAAMTAGRAKAGLERVAGTKPSHPLAAYRGAFDHPAYGTVTIGGVGEALAFSFHGIELPLSHFHYDRFDTPDDERLGKWAVHFGTSPQGEIDRLTMSLDEAEATFVRKPETLAPEVLARLAGTYLSPTGAEFEVALSPDGRLVLRLPGQPEVTMLPYKGLVFRFAEFADLTVEFVLEGERVVGIKQRDPSGEYLLQRK